MHNYNNIKNNNSKIYNRFIQSIDANNNHKKTLPHDMTRFFTSLEFFVLVSRFFTVLKSHSSTYLGFTIAAGITRSSNCASVNSLQQVKRDNWLINV